MKQTPYEYLKLKEHAVPVGEVTGNEAVAYQMWRDPRSKFKYPRLVRHPDTEVSRKINALLEHKHLQTTHSALECQAILNERPGSVSTSYLGGFDGIEASVTYLSTTLMSITEEGGTYCGGAHPNNYWQPRTFDLIRGEYLDWTRLFRAFDKNEYGSRKPLQEMLKFIASLNKSGRYFTARKYDKRRGWDVENYEGDASDMDYLTLYFVEPGKLNLALSGFGHCCSVSNGPYYSVPFSALKKPFLKPEAAKYLFPERE
jgi:hypothetical protein